MIRMIQSQSPGQAKSYFRDALSQADYYISDQELPGTWHGMLADRLELSGAADREAFNMLCENRHPKTGERLTPRTRKDRRVGYDINFHCPKSVSVLHVLSKDDHILTAFRDSVTETMQEIERDSKTRIRRGGVSEDRPTGELVWAQFVHQTARPVPGHLPDPHLHTHAFVFNATWDQEEQRIKAAQFGDIKRDMPYYQTLFHKTLSAKMTMLGYQVRKTDMSFEIEGVPKTVIDLFSKRTNAIGQVAKDKGVTDPKEKDALGARTRAGKDKGSTMADLKAGWLAQIHALPGDGSRDGDGGKTVRNDPDRVVPTTTAQACLDYALAHCFERRSVTDGRRILAAATKRSIGFGGVTVEDIKAAFQQDQRIITVQEKGRILCTTKEVLSEERRMVDLARRGQGCLRPLYANAPEISLIGQQGEAVRYLLTTPHRVSIVRGVAGSGKTTLLSEAVAHIERAGKTVTAVAPTARASRGVLREEGFRDATTVAHLLADAEMQAKLKDQVLLVDEAGLLGTPDMTRLLALTERQNARLILVGDTRQHASVIRGDALRILNTVARIPVAEVSKIYRQTRARFREAVKDLSAGNVAKAFGALDAMGTIREAGADDLVSGYVDAVKRNKTALVISPTHAQGSEVTAAIRKALREEGRLGKKEVEVLRLKNLSLTVAEKSDPQNFHAGQVVQFNQHAPSIKKGSRWSVVDATAQEVTIRDAEGRTAPLPLLLSKRYDVYKQETLALSKGDRVRITRNAYLADGARLNNGDMLTVRQVYKSGNVVLENPKGSATYPLPPGFGHIAHGHCITSQAAQGQSIDEVFVYQPAATFPATDARQFYVSVSRARDRVHIVTDDKADLLSHASNHRDRQSAIDLVAKARHRQAVKSHIVSEQSRQEHTRTRGQHERPR